MNDSCKPGGGNKPQPYIPAGNGDKSGEYTNKPVVKRIIWNCFIVNVRRKWNYRNSKLVKKVNESYSYSTHMSVSLKHRPNSVIKRVENGYVVSERYYDENGDVYLDIDYTNHGNPKTHPKVPHIHRWVKDNNGKLHRCKWEDFQ